MGNYKKISEDLFRNVIKSGLQEKTEKISVFKLGKGDLELPDGFDLVGEDENLSRFEYPTLSNLWNFSRENDGLVWYIHTKGCSKTINLWMKTRDYWKRCGVHSLTQLQENVEQWRLFMQYFVVTKHEICIKALEKYDTAGVALRNYPFPHYSGNFWWAKTSYIRSLKDPETVRDIIVDGWGRDREMAEFWIGTGKPKTAVLFDPLSHNFYRHGIPARYYRTSPKLM